MLERTFHSYMLKPKTYPYRSARMGTERPVRKIKLPIEYSGISFDLDYVSSLYPSSRWETENRGRFRKHQTVPVTTKHFEATTLDTRKHNPQSRHIFHIKRFNKKPVCSVQSQLTSEPAEDGRRTSIYQWSYKERDSQPNQIIRKHQKETVAAGIVPVKEQSSDFDVRTEMMLPVCDSTNMPSADNPHRYLVRKRKVPAPARSSGIVYPDYPQVSASDGDKMAATDEDGNRVNVSSLSGMPFSRRRYVNPPRNHVIAVLELRPQYPVCVSSLAGKEFTRRRQIQPPSAEINLGFDGGVNEREGVCYDDRVLPFMKAKPII